MGKYYRCENCNTFDKKIRGCIRPIRATKKSKAVWSISECFYCGGTYKKCKHCKGSNIVKVYRCPRALSRHESVAMLLPYFQRYVEHGEFPDKGAIIDQPPSLVFSLEYFKSVVRRYESDQIEQLRKEKK